MAVTTVPNNVVQGRGTPFPQGKFTGDLDEVKENWSEDKKSLDITLTFRNNAPADEDTREVGARPLHQRTPVIRDERSVVDVTDYEDEGTPFPLRLAAGQFAQLSVALGAPTTIAENGDVSFDMEAFIESLIGGSYKGRRVGFVINHRAWKSKTTKREGISAEVAAYFPLEENENVQREDAEPSSVGEARTSS